MGFQHREEEHYLEPRDRRRPANSKRLVKTADFLVESFDPGYLDGLGIGYTVLHESNPRLIMGSITPFGQSGPYAQWKGPDIVPWAMSGYMWMTGESGRAPQGLSASGLPSRQRHDCGRYASGPALPPCHGQRAAC